MFFAAIFIINVLACIVLVGMIGHELSKAMSFKRVGGMRFVRFGPLSVSYCITSKPVR